MQIVDQTDPSLESSLVYIQSRDPVSRPATYLPGIPTIRSVEALLHLHMVAHRDMMILRRRQKVDFSFSCENGQMLQVPEQDSLPICLVGSHLRHEYYRAAQQSHAILISMPYSPCSHQQHCSLPQTLPGYLSAEVKVTIEQLMLPPQDFFE